MLERIKRNEIKGNDAKLDEELRDDFDQIHQETVTTHQGESASSPNRSLAETVTRGNQFVPISTQHQKRQIRHEPQDRQEEFLQKKICTVVRTFSGHGSGKSGLRHHLASWIASQVDKFLFLAPWSVF
tara:strand:+ start:694 stop:1077 length:384 start_codon:yes stop_codon:yes gene_type:complete